MATNLDSAIWKIGRANDHVRLADSLIERFIEAGFYSVSYEQDRQRRLVIRCKDCKPIPPPILLLIGDAAHNLRASLDHLVVAFAKPRTEKEEADIQFPIYDSAHSFSSNHARKLRGVDPAMIAMIERLQPYHGRKRPKNRLLQQIQVVDNWDKHRTILAANAAVRNSTINITHTGQTGTIETIQKYRGRLESGAVLARIKLGGYWNVGDKVQADPKLSLLPVFDKGMPKEIRSKGLTTVIRNAGNFIANTVLPMFQKFA